MLLNHWLFCFNKKRRLPTFKGNWMNFMFSSFFVLKKSKWGLLFPRFIQFIIFLVKIFSQRGDDRRCDNRVFVGGD